MTKNKQCHEYNNKMEQMKLKKKTNKQINLYIFSSLTLYRNSRKSRVPISEKKDKTFTEQMNAKNYIYFICL